MSIQNPQQMTVTSPAFQDGGMMPRKHTCDDANVSPELRWRGVPEGTRSLVLIMDDLDIPTSWLRLATWTHWLVFDIAPGTSMLPEGVPKEYHLEGGAKQAVTSFRKPGYGGPCPLGGAHHYRFTVYALDCTLDLAPERTRKSDILRAMRDHVLAQGELTGRYRRG